MSEQPALPFPEPEGGPALPPVDAAPVLELRGVTVRYGSVPALDRVSLRLRPGAVTCVLGENGAGKSTLVQVVSGVRRHDDGELLLDGRPVRFRRPRQARSRGIATIWQDLAVVPLMTVWRNFWLGDEPTRGVWPLRRIDLDVARAGAARALARVGLGDVSVNQPAAALQPGQRHGLAVARALHFGARVLVADPFATVPHGGPHQVELPELFATADVVSLHAPPPADGSPVVGPEQVSSAPRGAVLVNTARSALVDDAAVLAGLESGQLACYAVDAFDEEPPALSPLLRHERTVLTPHLGGFTDAGVRRATRQAVVNLLAVVDPDPRR